MKVLIFGGTTEGRELAVFTADKADTTVCVTTEYGASLLPGNVHILAGRLDKEHMVSLIEKLLPDIVIDATHPYATEATANIKGACDVTSRRYIRVIREALPEYENAVYVNSAEEAAEYLRNTDGMIFIATGTKELPCFTDISERCVVRILDNEENTTLCREYGFENMITGLGPFSEEQNVRDMSGCSFIVTKESGKEGGFEEKIRACEKTGATPVVITRPKESGLTVGDVKKLLTHTERTITMRSSGILMHITSLPSPYGIGTLGRHAYVFVDFLKKSGQTYWQILPIGPTGFGDSPYQSYSAFAGNPLLIDIDTLITEGLVSPDDKDLKVLGEKTFYDYSQLFYYKKLILQKACMVFIKSASEKKQAEFDAFCSDNSWWLEDYALFMTLKAEFSQIMWTGWNDEYRLRDEQALSDFSKVHSNEILAWRFIQFKFFEQYKRLKKYANKNGILIYGDMPIYVSADSSDIWANPEMFMLDEDRRPVKVAGCPPDDFAPTGQLWGNPLYDWDYLEKTGYKWWVERVRYSAELFDLTRIDHFRGFESFYAIPAEDETAEFGEWQKGPGMKLFKAIRAELGDVSLVAEDLGFLTDEVKAMLREAGYPGMNVLEFAFGGDDSGYLPHNHSKNSVVYIGTHDNDTALGWYRSADEKTKKTVRKYLGLKKDSSDKKVFRALIRSAMASPAQICILQMQDLLGLGSEARMNIPSTIGGGNWAWRMPQGVCTKKLAKKLRELTDIYHRRRQS